MRPLPIEEVPGIPSFVCGASIVRGVVTPIVDLARLLGESEASEAQRLVTIKLDAKRRVGVLVDEVLGVRRHGSETVELPPLLLDATAEVVDDLTRLDDSLLTVLRGASLIPEEVWSRWTDIG